MPRGIPKHPKPSRHLIIACTRCGTPTLRYVSTQAPRDTFCTLPCYRAWCKEAAIAHFWERVEKTTTCWLWKGPQRQGGYGQIGIWYQGVRYYQASRLAWALSHGPIPAGLDVLHTCDTPPCVYEPHLFLGTDKDNQQDAIMKGRFYFRRRGKGEENLQHKLTWTQVRTIRRIYREEKPTLRTLAQMFQVHIMTIHNVVTDKTWKEVQPDEVHSIA